MSNPKIENAVAQALQILQQTGVNLDSPANTDKRLCEVIQEFLDYNSSIRSNKTLQAYRSTFRYVQSFFNEETLISDITLNMLQKYFNGRIANSSIYQARKDRINLSSLYSFAVDNAYVSQNIIKKIRPFRLPEKTPVYFSKEEFKTWLKHCDRTDVRNISIAAFNTGMRLNELLNLRWEEVDFKQRTINLSNNYHTTKSKKNRYIPMNMTMLQLLTTMQSDNQSGKVFKIESKAKDVTTFVSKQFKKIVQKAGLDEKLHFHSLRHGFASQLVQAGVSLYKVSQLLGHSDTKTTQIYAHLQSTNLLEAVELLD